jgi:two-component system, NtrC family, sensor kinase
MSENRYARLRKLILATMILVPAIPFYIVMGIGYYYFTTSIENSTVASMKRIVEDHRQMIDTFLTERKSDLEFVAESYTFDDLADPINLYKVFNILQNKSAAFVDLGVFNEEGIHVTYQGPYKLIGRDYGAEAWFKEVMKRGYYISDIFLGYRKVPHFIIAITREEPGRKWVLRSTIDTQFFTDLVERVRIGQTGESYILNEQGILQTQRRSGGNLMDKDTDHLIGPARHEGTESFLKKNQKGEEFLYATTWLQDKKWLLVVRREEADAFRDVRSATLVIMLINTVVGAGIIAAAFYLTNSIVRRMEGIDTEKEQLGQQLVRASRLAELGEMAAGFAHEINNPLQIMTSEQALVDTIFSDMIQKGELKESQDLVDLKDSMAQIKLQIERCAKITQAILKFGRQSEPVSKDIDLVVFIPEVTGMIVKKATVNGITVTEEIADNTPVIRGDPSLLQQVLLNLYNNAMDAITEGHGAEGGKLVIAAAPDEDGKVKISVRDNGVGISPENLKKVFSPFFTTKPVGKGTGLGLSVCYGIVDSMGGVMEVSSERGVGTTFTIRLPQAPESKNGKADKSLR